MDEDTQEVTAEEEEPNDEQEEAPDPQAEVEARLAEAEAKLAEAAKKEKALQRGFDEIARRERALAEAPADDDDVPDLDEQTQKALDRHLAKRGVLQTPEFMWDYVIDTEFKQVSKDTGIDYDDLRETAARYGLSPRDATPAAIREAADAAAKLHTAMNFDADAEVERRVEDRIKKMAGDGASVDAITPKREPATVSTTIVDDEHADPMDKVAALLKKWGPH